MASTHKLILIIDEVQVLVNRTGNNFDWSSWNDSAHASTELDSIRKLICSDTELSLSKMNGIFLPSGPLQELSLSSGWGDEFVALANRYDEAALCTECKCFQSTQQAGIRFSELGMTQDYAEIAIGKCPECAQQWIRYHYENEGLSGSGRWYLGAISDLQANTMHVNQAKAILEGLEWYWVGGSYYGGRISVRSGSIDR